MGVDAGLAEIVLLALAAAFAGWIDAVSCGGGLVQVPALLVLLPGATPAQVLATNKVSSVAGTAVAAWTYLRRVRPDLRTAVPMALVAGAVAAAGASFALYLPVSVFRPLVLVLSVLVALYTLRRPSLGEVEALRWAGGRHYAAALLAGAVIGFYDGIFGPGTGSFLVFALVGLVGYSFLQASAKARVVNLCTNLGALMIFIPQGAPLWRLGLLMAAGNVVGSWVGAHTAITRGSGFVRGVFLAVVGLLVLRLGFDIVR